ncbi:unnamed protein product [Candidula unifasciata]|uniref:Uncharacterized protein n=1 Tax=Candidula unifasciata TaxID=100452 RepID=A0A8S4A8P5_9EUPU|nr:unnamed protein product [Candidula unifasciata]
MFAHWLCYFNSAINPLIYNFMSVKFKKEFRNVFSCNKRPNTPLHESTCFNSYRKNRHLNASCNSSRSATKMLRAQEFAYPTFHDAKGVHVMDDDIMVSGESV